MMFNARMVVSGSRSSVHRPTGSSPSRPETTNLWDFRIGSEPFGQPALVNDVYLQMHIRRREDGDFVLEVENVGVNPVKIESKIKKVSQFTCPHCVQR